MTKRELLKEYDELCDQKRMHIDGVYQNSNKETIQTAIDCLKCPDDELADYAVVIKLRYSGIYNVACQGKDWIHHPHNRLFVYENAKSILENC